MDRYSGSGPWCYICRTWRYCVGWGACPRHWLLQPWYASYFTNKIKRDFIFCIIRFLSVDMVCEYTLEMWYDVLWQYRFEACGDLGSWWDRISIWGSFLHVPSLGLANICLCYLSLSTNTTSIIQYGTLPFPVFCLSCIWKTKCHNSVNWTVAQHAIPNKEISISYGNKGNEVRRFAVPGSFNGKLNVALCLSDVPSCCMQELLYLYGFVIENNPDDYLMVIFASTFGCSFTFQPVMYYESWGWWLET